MPALNVLIENKGRPTNTYTLWLLGILAKFKAYLRSPVKVIKTINKNYATRVLITLIGGHCHS